MERGDIHAGIAQCRAEAADDPGLVFVAQIDHVLSEFGLDLDSVDLHNAWIMVGKQRARDVVYAVVGFGDQSNQRLIVARVLHGDLAHDDVPFASDDRGIHHIDGFKLLREETLQ